MSKVRLFLLCGRKMEKSKRVSAKSWRHVLYINEGSKAEDDIYKKRRIR